MTIVDVYLMCVNRLWCQEHIDKVGKLPEAEQKLLELDVAIIGAGFSGMYMLHQIRDRLNLKTRVFEKADGVGGTWYWNRYPGARCDSESYYYSYSFSEELEQEWQWSSRYPGQAEILSYLDHVADRFELRPDIQFSTRIESLYFDEMSNRWHLKTEGQQEISAQFVVSAVGCLSTPNRPEFPGLDTFKGAWYHTGAWPHDGVDFSGKRVGLIGTGSTGIQATPVIASESDHLTVFQRTPNFSVPARNKPLDKKTAHDIKANYKEIRELCRSSGGGFPFAQVERLVEDVSEEERHKIYSDLWEQGGFRFGAESFGDLLSDQKANDTAADFIRAKICETVNDQNVAKKLLPNDHPYATKRPPIDTNYFETFNRDNVLLVDVRESPIEEITPAGLRTGDKEYELDILVFATGFDAMTGPLLSMDIHGSGGRTLAEAWQAGPRTYLGLQIAGFPNLFTITGPGSPSVLTNMPVAIEQHVEWISDCIEYLREHDLSRIEAKEASQEEWVGHVSEIASETLFPKANSWYMGANVPGKSRVFMPYVGGMDVYRDHCNEVVERGYEGFVLSR
jgi:cation diffusion facilitator CzcD-associated flavoprotein CzcO